MPPDGAKAPSLSLQMDPNGLSCVQVTRVQNSAVFRAARELDFERDALGSLGQLICDRGGASGSENASSGVRSTGLAGNGTIFVANSSGRNASGCGCIIWINTVFVLFFFLPQTLNE